MSSPLLSRFKHYITSERHLSWHTTRAYLTDIAQYATSLPTQGGSTIELATYPMLRTWVMTLIQGRLSNYSINRKIAAVKALYRFAYKNGYTEYNPTLRLRSLKVQKRIPTFFREEALHRLFDTHYFEDSFEGWRDKLILTLLYGTGIRLSELLALQEVAVDVYNTTLRVQGKGNKERIVPFPKTIQHTIASYLRYRNSKNRYGDSVLLLTDLGRPCYPMLIYRVVNRYLRQYAYADKYSPHILRHTFATHLLHKGACLKAIQDLLGHKSIATTQLYTHHTLDSLQQVFKTAHPRA